MGGDVKLAKMPMNTFNLTFLGGATRGQLGKTRVAGKRRERRRKRKRAFFGLDGAGGNGAR